ncbi:PREDICTED: uncharacterized protein LOC107083375 isoform X1 [Cyprinodon variegatus]|uniref:uncharacterized protein LOC107083375 isoform X1 n=1 Tax=Cyprinodon variegatus TaxID=28743 RepID=UPI000742779B|nr:PREDICTED: uncharacterized protein LOC107083375 isoform X1 [Cyprinodon variegatus]
MAKRDAYEAQFKLKAISYAEEHGNRAAAREFKINESMVRKWRKLENKLKQVKKTQLSFRGHKARWPELEERLERWIIEQRTSGASVSTVTVRRKAVTLAEEMKIEHFQGGPSWCFRFMKRCHFSIRTRNTVAQQRPVDYNEKLTSFHSYCSQHIADKLFQPSHITNMEEVPLTFDIPVNHTVEKKGTSTVAMHTTGYEHRNQVCSTPVEDSAPPPGPSVNESPDHDRENTDDSFKSRRCSVVRCHSWRRGAQCFSLPADPDKRLEWVQFLFLVNGQRITESSWVDIRVCAEHFTPSCFLQVNPATSIALLNTDAVPSVYRPADLEVKQETIEPIDADFKLEQSIPHDSPTPGSSAWVKDETSTLSAPGSPALSKVSESSESGYCKMLQEIMEKVNLLHKTKKYIVSEKQLLQLFSAECPLCQSKVKTEKFVHGALLVLNQQCLQCSYSKQWKNLSEKSVSAFLDDHQTECLEISLETDIFR